MNGSIRFVRLVKNHTQHDCVSRTHIQLLRELVFLAILNKHDSRNYYGSIKTETILPSVMNHGRTRTLNAK